MARVGSGRSGSGAPGSSLSSPRVLVSRIRSRPWRRFLAGAGGRPLPRAGTGSVDPRRGASTRPLPGPSGLPVFPQKRAPTLKKPVAVGGDGPGGWAFGAGLPTSKGPPPAAALVRGFRPRRTPALDRRESRGRGSSLGARHENRPSSDTTWSWRTRCRGLSGPLRVGGQTSLSRRSPAPAAPGRVKV